MNVVACAVATLLAFASFAAPAATAGSVTVTGTILDDASDAPLAGVRIELFGLRTDREHLGTIRADAAIVLASTTTGTDGVYRLADVQLTGADCYGVRILEDFRAGSLYCDNDGERSADEIRMKAIRAWPCGILRGRLISEDGKPISDAHLAARPAEETESVYDSHRTSRHWAACGPTCRTDADGRFEFRGLPPGFHWWVFTAHDEFAPRTAGPVAVTAAEIATLPDVRLDVGAAVCGVVRDGAGNPLAAATVVASRNRRGPEAMAYGTKQPSSTSVSNGTYRLEHLAPGDYIVTATIAGKPTSDPRSVSIAAVAARVDVDLVVTAGHFVSGRVVDSKTHTPIAGATVEAPAKLGRLLESPDPAPTASGLAHRFDKRGSTMTDASGRFRLDSLTADAVTLSVSCPGFEPASKDDVAVDTADVEIAIRKQTWIEGQVLDPDGKPVGHASIGMRDRTGMPLRSDGESEPETGRFRIESDDDVTAVFAVHQDFADSPDVTIDADGKSHGDVTIRLTRGGVVRGIVVVGSDRRPVSDATVQTQALGDARHPNRLVRTADDGTFELVGIWPGRVEVVASHAEWADARSAPIDIVDGGSTSGLVLAMSAGGAVRGSIYDKDGRMAPKRGMVLMQGNRYVRTVDSAEDGSFEFRGVTPGDYVLANPPRACQEFTWSTARLTVRDGEVTVQDLGPKPAPHGTGCRIHGRVRGLPEPMEDVEVHLTKRDTANGFDQRGVSAEADGAYAFDDVAAGHYILRVVTGNMDAKEGFSVPIDVSDRPDVLLDLVAPKGAVEGSIVDDATGKPLRSVPIVVTAAGASGRSLGELILGLIGDVKSGDDGCYRLECLAPGHYFAEAGGSGWGNERAWERGPTYARRCVEFTVVGDETVRVDFRLKEGRSLRGSVRDARGAPVQALVRVESLDGQPVSGLLWVETKTDGSFELVGLDAGDVSIFVISAKYALVRREAKVEDGGARSDFTLEPGGELTIEVLGPRGEAIEGAYADAVDERGVVLPIRLDVLALLSGGADVPAPRLVAGTYTVRAAKAGVGNGSATVRVEDGKTASARIVLK
ncbi:MAG: carboxypeptidase regulatory-like domain-containing protein [Planctomycetes bacterium]|nr:carboxypeptidase regulatory-like domain-containing protein [Planctomycetota bacterium]